MTILCKTALLDRLGSIFALAGNATRYRFLFGTDIPFKQVARHGRANDNVGVVGIEHGLRDLVLAIQCQLRPALKTDAKDVNEAVRLIHIPLATLTVGGEKYLRLRR